MPEAHSKYSASGFEAAMLCPGKPVMEQGKPDPSSKYADEGTAAHTLLSWCIEQGKPALHFRGHRIPVGHATWEVTEEMATAVQTALDNIKTIAADGMVLSEQRVCYAKVIGVPDSEGWGTSDIIAAVGSELQVHDYKHGMGVVVEAGHDVPLEGGAILRKPNVQMALYGLGALEACQGVLGDFETVRLVIHQPRIKDAPSEYVLPVADLQAWATTARSAVLSRQNAERLHQDVAQWETTYLSPNEKSCKFCKAKATCSALRAAALMPVMGRAPADPDEFAEMPTKVAEHVKVADDTWLDAAYPALDIVELWMKSVLAEIERRLLAGSTAFKNVKLVQGRAGGRAWRNAEDAENKLKAMRLKVEEMYDLKLISPTSAEKLVKAKTIGPRQWSALQELIVKPEGKPHVAPVSDSRPALVLTPAVDDFTDVSTETAGAEFA